MAWTMSRGHHPDFRRRPERLPKMLDLELRVPAEDVTELNENIGGRIQVARAFGQPSG